MKILVAEQNQRLLLSIIEHFERRHFIVDSAENGHIAMEMLRQVRYDAVIMDFSLLRFAGKSILTERQHSLNSQTPFIIISDKAELSACVAGLNAGADDYISKPLALLELEARLFAVLRRAPVGGAHLICHGDICFDVKSQYLRVGEKIFTLSRRESMLLAEMLRAAPGLVTKSQLEKRLYSFDESVSPNAIEALVSRVRRKLAKMGATCRILTARGLGYRLEAD